MIKEIIEHRSIRSYTDQKIEDSVMTRILEAATRASNTGNMQVYSIVVSTDQKIKDALSPCHFNQPMVKSAAAVLTFCADINRFSKWCEMRDAKPEYDNFTWYYNATIDAVLASQNASLAAENEGLGICYLGTTIYTAAKISEVLELPQGVIPVTTVTIGYPDTTVETPLTDRLPLEGVVHYQTYKDYSEDDINAIWKEKEASELTAKLLQDNDLPSLARIFTERRYKGSDNRAISRSLLETAKERGFMNNEDN